MEFIRDFWPLVSFLGLIIGYAAHHWLGQRYVTKKDMKDSITELSKELEKEIDKATARLGTAEKMLAGFNDLLSNQNSMVMKNMQRIEEVDKYGSAPLRRVEQELNEIMGKLRELKTSLMYIAREKEKREEDV